MRGFPWGVDFGLELGKGQSVLVQTFNEVQLNHGLDGIAAHLEFREALEQAGRATMAAIGFPVLAGEPPLAGGGITQEP